MNYHTVFPLEHKAYIYGLRYTDSGSYFYVGSAKDPFKRFKNHISRAKEQPPPNRHLAVILLNQSRPYTMDVIDVVFDGENRYEVEREWYHLLKISKHPLTNIIEPTIDYIQNFHRLTAGKKLSPEHRAKLSRARRGLSVKRRFPRSLSERLHSGRAQNPNGLCWFDVVDWLRESPCERCLINTIEIAEELGVSRALVHRAKKTIRQEFKIPKQRVLNHSRNNGRSKSATGVSRHDIEDWLRHDPYVRCFYTWDQIMKETNGGRCQVSDALRHVCAELNIDRSSVGHEASHSLSQRRNNGRSISRSGVSRMDIEDWLRADPSRIHWGNRAIGEAHNGASKPVVHRALNNVCREFGIVRSKTIPVNYKPELTTSAESEVVVQ